MGYDYDSDQGVIPLSYRPIVYGTEGDSTMSNDPISPDRPATAPRKRGTIQSVDRAARILKALGGGPRRLGVSELARRLGLPAPTVHGLLQTLQTHGFVEQGPGSDKYQLSAGLLRLGYSYLDLNELRGRSIMHADRLAARADAAVRVGVMHGESVVVVHHVFRPDESLQILEVGAELPLHASALGKAIVAFSAPHVIEDLLAEPLPKLTSRTLAPAALRDDLAATRVSGLGRERDEAVLGESSLAAPIFDHAGHPVGAIGIVGDSDRISARRPTKSRSAAVIEAARGVSRELGAARWPAPAPPE
jgi:DNA-binding IclR family transcriptional regulator